MNNQSCGTCRYHKKDYATDEWICLNENSENYTLETEYQDGEDCMDWEERG